MPTFGSVVEPKSEYSSRRPASERLSSRTPLTAFVRADERHEQLGELRDVMTAIQHQLGRDGAACEHVVGVEPLAELVIVPLEARLLHRTLLPGRANSGPSAFNA